MPLTLAEAFDKVEKLRHTRSIWLEVVDHLRAFVDDEVRKASKGISSDGKMVPQQIVREFITGVLTTELHPLNEQIEHLENLYVEEKVHDKVEQHEANAKESSEGTKEEGKAPDQTNRPAGKRTISSPKGKSILGKNGPSSASN
jgi:hypothetical protein